VATKGEFTKMNINKGVMIGVLLTLLQTSILAAVQSLPQHHTLRWCNAGLEALAKETLHEGDARILDYGLNGALFGMRCPLHSAREILRNGEVGCEQSARRGVMSDRCAVLPYSSDTSPEARALQQQVISNDYADKTAEYLKLIATGLPLEVARAVVPLSQLTDLQVYLNWGTIPSIVPHIHGDPRQVLEASFEYSSQRWYQGGTTCRSIVPGFEEQMSKKRLPIVDNQGDPLNEYSLQITDYMGNPNTVVSVAQQSIPQKRRSEGAYRRLIISLMERGHITPFGIPRVSLIMGMPLCVGRHFERSRHLKIQFKGAQEQQGGVRPPNKQFTIQQLQALEETLEKVKKITAASRIQLDSKWKDFCLTQWSIGEWSLEADPFNLMRTVHMRSAKGVQPETIFVAQALKKHIIIPWGFGKVYDVYKGLKHPV
jgi:hypothetical protein